MKQRHGSIDSGREILPLVLKLVQPKSVIDIGCGIGSWLSICKEYGIEDIVGVDGQWVDKTMLLIPEKNFLKADLRETLDLGRTFDLAISVEVAEHISKEYASVFIDSLTRVAPVVLFSANIPHGGGDGHVNEQWQDYWANLFLKCEYAVIDCIRPAVWNNENVLWWYRQNTLLYVRKDYLEKHLELKRLHDLWKGFPLRIVHPLLFEEINNPKTMSLRKALTAIPFGFLRVLRRMLKNLLSD